MEVTIEYYGKSKDRTRFRWLKFEELIIPYVDEKMYIQLRHKKHGDLYSGSGLAKDFHETRKEKLQDIKKLKKIEMTNKINEIMELDLTANDKTKELVRIGVPKYKVESLLKDQGITKTKVELMEQYVLTEQSKELELSKRKKEKMSRERKK